MRIEMILPVALVLLITACGGGGGTGPGGSASTAQPLDYATPVLVSETLRFAVLEGSQAHTCGTATDGSTWCWGQNEYGELGTSAVLDRCDIPGIKLVDCTGTPQRVATAPAFASLTSSLGGGNTCGITAQGASWCWGFGIGGQLGDGRSANSVQPVAVAGALQWALLRKSTSAGTACGLTLAGESWCWGPNGNLWGNGGSAGAASPVRIDWGRSLVALDLGEQHGCGLTSSGQAWCWGSNWYGQLGLGTAGGSGGLDKSTRPLRVLGAQVFRSIAAGSDHSCALDDAGAAWCWGIGSAVGSAGNTAIYVGTPQAVAGSHVFTALASGQLHSCGLTAAGVIWCWGQNLSGALGDGTHTDATVPVRVQASVNFTQLAHRANCALTADGQAWCWGDNSYGQAGRRSTYAK